MDNKHMKRYSISSVIRKIQNKITDIKVANFFF